MLTAIYTKLYKWQQFAKKEQKSDTKKQNQTEFELC
jgi:hypothetical protein